MRLVLIIVISILAACSGSQPVTSRSFSFYDGEKPKKIKIRVPKGYVGEMQRVSEHGKEQYYTYGSGSRLFIGLNMTWQSSNQERKFLPFGDTIVLTGSFSGADKEGLFWKEIHYEGFVIGYSFVPADERTTFDLAVHSMRFK